MCDCFHLAFPNWHGSPVTGAGRRLKGPEPETVADSICEEPFECLEGERPRPQGSSPVDEYPETDKYTDIDKQSGGGKKGKRGFGSLFDKRSPAKMSQLESQESGVIVKMAKESEGLVVSGGGKEGIFIKEVRPESPASKLLSVHEGDQILSATVYFDDVTYEDALQILEHANSYKMELLLKRRPINTSTIESEPALEVSQVDQRSFPEMRGHSKTKRKGDRISWPKFPSFSKSRKSHFKRSHSTSEADDLRMLELSPTTSDTESPIKSQEAVKSKSKKHKLKLSKMKGHKSRSVEQPDQGTDIQGMEIQPSQDDVHSPDGLESISGDTPQVYMLESESEQNERTRIKTEYKLPELTGFESKQQKAELISLDKTLKTTDITIAFADQEFPSSKKSPEKKQKKMENERSELKFSFKGKERKDQHKQDIPVKSSENSLYASGTHTIISDLSAYDNTLVNSGETIPSTDVEIDHSIQMPDVELIRKSTPFGKERELKAACTETNVNALNIRLPKISCTTMEPDMDGEIQALKLPTDASTDDVIAQVCRRTATTEYKLPRVDFADFVNDEPIKMTQKPTVDGLKALPNREDIEIPGMEDASTNMKSQVIKYPKTEFTLPVEEIQAQTIPMVIDVDRVKEAVSKLPGFKLPKCDIAGLSAHQGITMTDVNAENVNRTGNSNPSQITDINAQLDIIAETSYINASPEKMSRSLVTTIKLPNNQLSDPGAHTPVTMTEIYHTKTKKEAGMKQNVEKKNEIHEGGNIQESTVKTITQKETPNKLKKGNGAILEPKLTVLVPEMPTITAEERKVISDNYTKDLDKKSKEAKMSVSGFGITQPDTRLTDIGIGLPKHITCVQKDDMETIDDKEPEAVMKGQKLQVEVKDTVGSSSRFKLPSFKFPKFGATASNITVDVPDVDKNIKDRGMKIPEPKGTMTANTIENPTADIKAPIFVDRKSEKLENVHLPTVDVSLLEGKVEIKKADMELTAPEIQVGMKDDVDLESQGSKFKFPKFGLSMPKVKGPQIDLSVSKKEADVKIPEAKPPSVQLEVLPSEVSIPEGPATEVDVEMKKPKMAFGWFSKSEVKAPEVDVSLPKIHVALPEGKIEVIDQEVEMTAPELPIEVKHDIDLEEQGSKFKLPKFGISMPTIKGPQIDLSVSKKDKGITLPEGVVEVQPPSGQLNMPSSEVNISEGDDTKVDKKMKKPQMSFGGFSKPELKAPNVDINLPKVDTSFPKGKLEMKEADMEFTAPEIQVGVKDDVDLEGQGSKFKFPKFGMSLPNVKGPQFDVSVSTKEADVKIPEAKPLSVQLEVLPSEISIPEGPATEVDVKVKKPKMSFGWFSKSEVKAPEVDVSLPKVDVALPEGKVEVIEKEVEMTAPEMPIEVKHDIDLEEQGSKFKLPKFGISMPTVKGPQIDLSVSKKDKGVTLPEGVVEVQPPSVQLNMPSSEVNMSDRGATKVDIKVKKPQMSFGGFSTPELKAPNVDVSLPKVDALLLKGKLEVKEADMEFTAPEIEVGVKDDVDLESQGSKFKFPKFGMSLPKVKGHQFDVSVSKEEADVKIPEAKPASVQLEVLPSEVSIPEGPATEVDVKVKKPKMSFGWFSKSQVKAPEVDVSLPKVDVNLPEGKVEVIEQEVEITAPEMPIEVKHDIDLEEQGNKFKLPKFGISMPTVKGPQIDLSVSKKDKGVTLPEGVVEVQPPSVQLNMPSSEVNMSEGDATKVDVKMKKPPMSFGGFSTPELKAPNVDISLPTVDASLPEGKVEMKEADMEFTAPEIQVGVKDDVDLEGQGSKFKLPKFGMSLPKVKGPQFDVSVSTKEADVKIPEAKPPSVQLEVLPSEVSISEGPATEDDVKVKKPKISFGWFSKSEVKAPEVDVSLPKVDVALPEGKVKVIEQKVEMTAPEMPIEVKHDIDLEEQQSKFKLPKFGISMPTVKGPQIDLSVSKKDKGVTLPEGVVEVQPPSVQLNMPSSEVNMSEGDATKVDVKMKKPQMSFGGFSKPELKAPNIDISLPKVDALLPEGKLEMKEADMEFTAPEIQVGVKDDVDLEGQESKFKFPKFGMSLPKIKGPQFDVSVLTKEADVKIPEAKPPSVQPEVLPSEVNIPEGPATEVDVKVKKPKMSFGWFSKSEVKAPEVDVSLPKLDVALPEGKVEVIEQEVEMTAPELPIEVKHDIDLEEQQSKFKLPKFGISMPTVKGPQIDLSVSKKDKGVTLPEGVVEVQPPSVQLNMPSSEVNMSEGDATKVDVKMKKPQMSFGGFSKPELKAPNIDISLPKVDALLPEGKLEMKEAVMEFTAPEIQVGVKDDVDLEGQESKFKFPKFGMSLPKIKGPQFDVSVLTKEADVKIPEAKPPSVQPEVLPSEVNIPEGPATEVDVKVKKPKMSFGWFSKSEVKAPEVDVSLPKLDVALPEGKVEVIEQEVEMTAPELPIEVKHDIDLEKQGSKFKLPKFGISMPTVKAPQIDLSVSKKDKSVTLPEAVLDVQPPSVQLNMPSSEVNISEGDATKVDEKMKKPQMSFGGLSKQELKAPKVDVRLPKVDASLPEGKVEVIEANTEFIAPEIQGSVKDEVDLDGQVSKFKFPKFGMSLPKVKGPQIDLSVSKKEADVKIPEAKPLSVQLDVLPSEVSIPEGPATDVDAKVKKPKMSFGWFSKTEVKAPEVAVTLPKVDVTLPEGKVEVLEQDVEMTAPEMPIEVKHDVDLEEQEGKIKLPKYGISMPKVKGPQIDVSVPKMETDVTIPEAKVDVKPPGVKLAVLTSKVDVPEGPATEVDVKMKTPKMSFGWFSKQEVKAPEVDVSLPKVDVAYPERKVEVVEPDLELTAPEMPTELKHDVDLEEQDSKFKLPKFGISMPKVKGPQIDLSVSKKDKGITLPEGVVEIQPTSVQLNMPSSEVNISDGDATKVDVKMKKPQMSFGGFSKPELKAPNVDISLPKVDASLPEGKVEMKEADMEFTAPEIQVGVKDDVDLEGQGSKFKFPKFGMSLPKVKGPQFDVSVSKKEADLKILEANPPSVQLEVLPSEVSIPEGPATEVDVKVKKPKMSFGWFSKSEVKAPEVDVSLPKVDVAYPEGKVEVEEPDLELTAPEMPTELKHDVDLEEQDSKFKLPKFGISMPKVKGPQIDLSVSKKDKGITLPEGVVENQPTSVQLNMPSSEVNISEGDASKVDVKMKKPQMSFGGFSKPELKAPNVDISLPKVDASLPEGKDEMKEADMEFTAPEIQVGVKDDVDLEGQGSKFKFPKFGMSLPKVKGPQFDVSVSKKEADLKILEAKPPSVQLEVLPSEVSIPEGSATEVDVKVKKPKMSFGWFSKSEVKAPEVDVSLPKVDVALPEGTVKVKEQEVEMTAPEMPIEVKHDIDLEEQGSKFKLPKFGISMPTVKGPQIDLNVSKKVKGVTLPEGVVEVQPPSVQLNMPSSEVNMSEGDATKVDVKVKKPQMSFGGFSKPELKALNVDVSLPKVDASLPKEKLEIKEADMEFTAPEIQVGVKDDVDHEGQGSKFKFPKFGMSLPKVKGPQFDVSVSKKEADEKILEAKPPSVQLEVLPSEVNIPEGPATEVDVKVKKPKMSFGWFSKSEVKAPEVDVSLPKVDVALPEGKVKVQEQEVKMTAPEMPIEVKHDIDLEEQGSKFKLPKFGISMPTVKGPQIDLSVSKKVKGVTLPEGVVEVQPPSVQLNMPSSEVNMSEGVDVKVKKPQMSFGGFSKAELKAPNVDVSLPKVDALLPKEKPEIKEADMEFTAPEIQVGVKDDVDLEGQGSKFKFPKFGMSLPKVKGPQFDVSVSKKEADEKILEAKPPSVQLEMLPSEVSIPEGPATEVDVKVKKPKMSFGWFSKSEVKAPEVDVSLPKVDVALPEGTVKVKEQEVEMTAPEMPIEVKHYIDLEEQQSKFKLPKFGISMPTVKGPQIDLSVSKKDKGVTLPESVVEVQPTSVQLNMPSSEVNMSEGDATKVDVKMKKPQMSFGGFSKPELKAPNVDVSLPKVDALLPEGKVEMKESDMEFTAPEIQVGVNDEVDLDGQGSKFKFPKFGLSLPKVKGPQIDVSVSKKETDVTIPEAKVDVKPPSVQLEVLPSEVNIPEGPATEVDVKVKKPKMSFGWFSKSEVKAPEVDVSLPKVDVALPEGKVKVQEQEVKMTAPEMPIEVKHDIDLEEQGSKFKLPKFGISMPTVKGPQIDLSVSKKVKGVTLPEGVVEGQPPSVQLNMPSSEVNMSEGVDVKVKKPQMSFGGFSKAELKAPNVDVSLLKVDALLPKEKLEIKEADMEFTAPEIQVGVKDDVDLEGQGSKFKFPKFGMSLPKVKGPQFDVSVSKKEADEKILEAKPPSVQLEMLPSEVSIPEGPATEVDVKVKKPKMSFGWFSKSEVKAPEVDVSLPKVDVALPEGKVKVKEQEVEMTAPEMPIEVKHYIDLEEQQSKFKLPKFGISMPTVKGPQIDLSVSKKDKGVTLPESVVEVQPTSVQLNMPSSEVNMSEGDATKVDVKMKKPQMSFGGFSKPELKAPNVDVSLPKVDALLPEGKVEMKESDMEFTAPEIQVGVNDEVDLDGQGSKFKFPKFGLSLPKVKGPQIDLSVSKKETDVTIPEAKVDVKPPGVQLNVLPSEVGIPEGPATEVDVKIKKPQMTFGWFSKQEEKTAELDVSLPQVDVVLPEGNVENKQTEIGMTAPEMHVGVKSDVHLEGQGSKFKFPKFGLSMPKVKGPQIDLSLFEKEDITVQEAKMDDKPHNVQLKVPPNEVIVPEGPATDIDVKIKKPRMTFGWFSKPELKSPEVDASLPKVHVSLLEEKMDKEIVMKTAAPEIHVDVKQDVSAVDGKLETPDMHAKPIELCKKKPGISFTKLGFSRSEIPVAEIDLIPPKDDLNGTECERPSVEEITSVAAVDVLDVDLSKPTSDVKVHGSPSKGQASPSKVQGSPSKFKLPTFKMPKLSISKSKPENVHQDISTILPLENDKDHIEPERQEKSQKLPLTKFGEVLSYFDVEFNVPTLEEVEEKLTGSTEEIASSEQKALNDQTMAEAQFLKEKEESKDNSKFGWFKFPSLGQSSPSDTSKRLEQVTSEKVSIEKSPEGDSLEQDISSNVSVQSSDAFADISSTVTSEQVGPSLASPTKVTVKYSDPIATDAQGDIITSTARTKMISVKPSVAEKVTISMLPGTSSSVNTLNIESSKHVITSNLQAIPATEKATLITDFGLQTGTTGTSSVSWSMDDPNKTQSDGQTIIEKHVVREMSGSDKETVVITRRVFGAEPISDETASTIKQMKDTMHSEKMRFFDSAELEGSHH